MTRARALLARAIILALLLLSVGGGVANAAPGARLGPSPQITTLPDDPGYTP